MLLVGPSRCGKDTMGEWLDRNSVLTYGGTTSKYLCPYVAAKQGLTPEEAYPIRHQHQKLWYDTGNELRERDPGCLLRASLENGNLSAGVRDAVEITYACQHRVVDHIVWIERDVPRDPTLMFDLPFIQNAIRESRQDIELHVLFNHTTEAEFLERVWRFAHRLHLLPSQTRPSFWNRLRSAARLLSLSAAPQTTP